MKICQACRHRFEAVGWRCPDCNYAPDQQGDTLLFAPALARDNGGYNPEFYIDLAKLEPNHFWFRNRNRLLSWTMQKYFPAARNFLEIGCGTGFVSNGIRQAFPELKIAGSELFLDVLEHIEEDEAVLRQLHQAAKPRGGLLVTVPQHPGLWSAADDSACHKRRYTRQELINKVVSAGFKVLRLTSFVSLLLPLLWASRRTRKNAKKIASNAEFQVTPVVNDFLERILRIESLFIRQGISFPAGGSLLLVGQKP